MRQSQIQSFRMICFFTFVLNVMLWRWKQDPDCRESDHRAYWLARNHMILDCLLAERSSIICLQVCVLHLFNGLGCGKAYTAFWWPNTNMVTIYSSFSLWCVQEFWVGNEELVNIYEKRLGDAGYINFKLGRTNNRGDGMSCFIVLNACPCFFLLHSCCWKICTQFIWLLEFGTYWCLFCWKVPNKKGHHQ